MILPEGKSEPGMYMLLVEDDGHGGEKRRIVRISDTEQGERGYCRILYQGCDPPYSQLP